MQPCLQHVLGDLEAVVPRRQCHPIGCTLVSFVIHCCADSDSVRGPCQDRVLYNHSCAASHVCGLLGSSVASF